MMGEKFTLPDAYLFVVQRWGSFTNFDISPFRNVVAHAQRIDARPTVQAALDAEKWRNDSISCRSHSQCDDEMRFREAPTKNEG
jgi:hypothetical protein